MDQFFSTFFLYSFLGFLIEVAYTRLCHHPKQDRKCLLFLPLCPVYGLGALAVLSLPALLLRRPLLVFLAGALVATLVEYVVAVFTKRAWGSVSGNTTSSGQSLWADLPPIHAFLGGIVPVDRLWAAAAVLPSSGPDTPWADSNLFLLFAADGLLSLFLLHRTGSTDCLLWYRRDRPVSPGQESM